MRRYIRIARLLAKEATYRFTYDRKSGRILKNPVYTNIIATIFFTIFSLGSAYINILLDKSISSPQPLILTLVVEISIAIFSTLFLMAYNLHIISTEKILENLLILPIKPSNIKVALILLNVYWGVYAQPFLYIPGSILYTIQTKNLLYLTSGIEISIFSILLTLALGFLAGSISHKTTRNPLFRTIATIAWLILMGLGFIISVITRYIPTYIIGNNAIQLNEKLLKVIPPFTMLYQIYEPGITSIISISSIVLMGLLLDISLDRYWNTLMKTPPPYKVQKSLQPIPNIRLPRIPLWLYKDLKILIRKPKFLASTLYLLLFPLIIPLLMGFTTPIMLERELIPYFILSMGSFTGSAVTNLYIMEGEGAKLLYKLPITKKRLIYGKLLTILLLSLLGSGIIGVYTYIMYEINILYIPLICIIYVLSTYTSSILISLIYIGNIPPKPSAWTQYTFSGIGISLKILGVITLYLILSSIAAIPQVLNIFNKYGLIEINIPQYFLWETTPYIETIIIILSIFIVTRLRISKLNTPL